MVSALPRRVVSPGSNLDIRGESVAYDVRLRPLLALGNCGHAILERLRHASAHHGRSSALRAHTRTSERETGQLVSGRRAGRFHQKALRFGGGLRRSVVTLLRSDRDSSYL